LFAVRHSPVLTFGLGRVAHVVVLHEAGQLLVSLVFLLLNCALRARARRPRRSLAGAKHVFVVVDDAVMDAPPVEEN